ncbi:c-type cytochrome biogenesis protein CcsB [Cylindrospermopsis raciborskii S07]|jgi:cytochrome c-type biogenesis protein CcsB|uniref:Cytochrome c biogenesis protein CcsA n=2 Tax=Cylindrospermopsis raciborskii TaxID=77022 RepID=A0A853MG23_9CYAN|nr:MULTISPECIES: c-type cytochrome biogenesis protein CcsB [Cylindrospermopsis]MBU6344186.1 c-type cytochrome biogenesis protein CcsB [Cyanobacteria bacterium REEB494]EFA70140.1 Cytochrome c assembly protein [Cylindrospermopsis raciborskii CS-505]KRH97372.1 cytochrome C biogenesis protein [Cylindrospermopsis sp. CR12]MCH4904163.1 c-type cytochrome biogenesis protein CcsB [Cylindrospermopsis raciborskii CHAB3438]MEB3145141.1 c-type cytochrome biogenesis protein CcsB [Cylindrospermopsis racibors
MNLVVLQNWLDNASFAILFCTMLIYWVGTAFPSFSITAALGTAGMAIANLSIAVLLTARWMEAGYFPLSNLYESLFFLTWGITAIHLIAEYTSRSRLVGVVTAPVAMGITAFATLTLPSQMQNSEPLVPALKSNWLMMHVSVMMLSYSALMVGSLLAIAFLIVTQGQNIELQGSSVGNGGYRTNGYKLLKSQELMMEGSGGEKNGFARVESNQNGNGYSTAVLEVVKADHISPVTTLSPQRLTLAETLDNISYRVIGLGFPLLTIGIIAGGVWANEAWGSYWSWDPKETWALITWLVFAAYLHARITRGWQGRKPAILAAGGFLVVWTCYLGVNLLGKGLHSYGWFL